MPKIIEKLDEQIVTTFIELLQHNEETISMRQIALRLNIAVGTIYNYFPNKEELFKAVFRHEWSDFVKKTVEELHNLNSTNAKLETTVRLTFENFYKIHKTIKKRRSFFHAEGKNSGPPHPYNHESWSWLFDIFSQIWLNIFPFLHDSKRLTLLLVSSCKTLTVAFPSEQQENFTFLISIIKEWSKEQHETDE